MVIFNHNNPGYCGPVLLLERHGSLLPGEGSGIRLSSYWPWFGPGLNWPGLFFCLLVSGGVLVLGLAFGFLFVGCCLFFVLGVG
jgi:hypothetical protein